MRDDDLEGRPRLPVRHEIGCDLSPVSVDELRERISMLETEVARLTGEIERKLASRLAASSVFKA